MARFKYVNNKTRSDSSKKPLLIVLAIVLVLAVIGVGVYFLFIRDNGGGSGINTVSADIYVDGCIVDQDNEYVGGIAINYGIGVYITKYSSTFRIYNIPQGTTLTFSTDREDVVFGQTQYLINESSRWSMDDIAAPAYERGGLVVKVEVLNKKPKEYACVQVLDSDGDPIKDVSITGVNINETTDTSGIVYLEIADMGRELQYDDVGNAIENSDYDVYFSASKDGYSFSEYGYYLFYEQHANNGDSPFTIVPEQLFRITDEYGETISKWYLTYSYHGSDGLIVATQYYDGDSFVLDMKNNAYNYLTAYCPIRNSDGTYYFVDIPKNGVMQSVTVAAKGYMITATVDSRFANAIYCYGGTSIQDKMFAIGAATRKVTMILPKTDNLTTRFFTGFTLSGAFDSDTEFILVDSEGNKITKIDGNIEDARLIREKDYKG
ncbi:MAG: hypothetical protein PHX51_04875 [Clostridia bacterium]|nr:hypothetical protein [Clostridia bacterium]